MIDGTNAVGKAADGRVVGDREAGVCVGEFGFAAACDDNPRTFVVREQCHGTGNAAAASGHYNGFVLQCITHQGSILQAAMPKWATQPRSTSARGRVNAEASNSQKLASYPTAGGLDMCGS